MLLDLTRQLLLHILEVVDARVEVLDLPLVHPECLPRLLHRLGELLVLLLVVGEDLRQLLLLVELQSRLLRVDSHLLLDLVVLLRDLLGHLGLDGAARRLLLEDLLIHHLALLLDLLHERIVLGLEHRVLLGHLSPAFLVELLSVVANLLLNHGQVVLEVRDDVLPLLLLTLDDALMVLLQALVLVLILSCQYLVLAEYLVSSEKMLFIDGFRF